MSEKENPMDVRFESDGDADGEPVYDMAFCPACERLFEEMDDSWECNYCPECGQRLNWEGGAMSEGLKPCPFCGGEATYIDDYFKHVSVQCNHCLAGIFHYTEKDEVVEAWNRRTVTYSLHPLTEQEKEDIAKITATVKPIPCVRDEHGEIKGQTVKQLFAKIDEELNEFKIAIFQFWSECNNDSRLDAAEEAADTITAITTMLEATGIGEAMRDEAQRRVNSKNRERGRL